MEVIAIFDIGKTNKKLLLFDKDLHIVHQEEKVFEEIKDDDGFPCDDIDGVEAWMDDILARLLNNPDFIVKAMNITTYGATLVYLDKQGNRISPVYNYLKPMPEDVLEGFYERYGGKEEFCRRTASPALGMLNSGLQIVWLKKYKPEIFARVSTILHLPQYLSYRFNRHITSEYTSIGCHTAMWDFDNNCYHTWLADEGILLPEPVSNDTVFNLVIKEKTLKTGIGIHDSSSSLVPYFMGTNDQFILASTGTWCILMNPFNSEPLTAEQLSKDSLCYMSIQQKQVKSSRVFLGHMHDVNVEHLNRHFGTAKDFYKTVKTGENKISRLLRNKERYFFSKGIPEDYVDRGANLSVFLTFDDAYHKLIADLVDITLDSLKLIIPAQDHTKLFYISGGFARNEIFTRLLAARIPDKKNITSTVDHATALGAAMIVFTAAFPEA